MKKYVIYFSLFLILLELICRLFLFCYNIRLSYLLNKGYYRFHGKLSGYAKVYVSHLLRNQGIRSKLIVEDKFNRRFYTPNINLTLNDLNFRTNAFGMRERDIDYKKGPNVYRIICLGSSYTLSGDIGNTFTDILEMQLNNKCKGVRFEVINASLPGQTIMGSFMNFSLNWRMLNPDMVIIDDVLDNVESSVDPFYLKNYVKLKKIENHDNGKRIDRYIALFRVIKLIYVKPTLIYNAPTEEGLAYYEAVLESLVLLAKGMGCKVVLLSCGISVDRNHNFATDNPGRKLLESHFSWFTATAIVQTIEEYNKIMEKIAKKNQVTFFDMSQVVPKDGKHFEDATHRSDKGNEVFANALMDKLTAEFDFN